MENKPPPVLTIKATAKVLAEPGRWQLLRVLARGEAMPVREMARRIGKTPNMTSKHIIVLRKAGIVVAKYPRHYSLLPSLLPAPDATHLDLGHCLIKLH